MSNLQDLCGILEGIDGDILSMARDLHGRAQTYSQAASQAATAARSAEGEAAAALARTAAALSAAARHCAKAAMSLTGASREGQAYVQRTVGASTAGGYEPQTGAAGSSSTSASQGPGSSLDSFWDEHPDEYIRPDEDDWTAAPSQLSRFSHPSEIVSWVNDGGTSRTGRAVNCADCARSFELSWRGKPQVSAARAKGLGGESFERVNTWLPKPLSSSSLPSVEHRLSSLGPGSSAYIAVHWKGGGGHAFNAVNRNGTVYFIDTQPTGGAFDVWPPKRTSPGYGYGEEDIESVYATIINVNGDSV